MGGEEASGRASRKSRDYEGEEDTLSRKRRDRHEERPRYSPQSEQRDRKHNSNRGKFWCHEDLHDKPSKDAGMSSARAQEEAEGKDGQALQGALVIESARQSPVSHPLEDPPMAPSPAAIDLGGPANGVLKSDHGFVLKPLQNSSARNTAACDVEPRPQSGKSPQTSPGKGDQRSKRPHTQGRAPAAKPGKTASAKHAQVPHNRLSFGEELDEEDAAPSSSLSLAQSTANRFSTERELRLVPGNSMASPFSAFEPEAMFSNGRRPKTLGPMIFGVAQARGPRPYMEDRYTIISSYTPLSFTSQPMPDDIVRSYAAVFDGHNGTKAAEHACARLHTVLAQEPALRTCTGAAAGSWARQDLSSREAQEAADMGHALKHAFNVVDDEILDSARAQQGRDGATALVVLRIGEVLWAAHAGDSRAVLCRGGQAVRLTQDHKPELSVEKARVEAVGGKVNFQRCWRVICPARNGRPASGLAVSRSFGDLDFKEPSRFIECEPDVTRLRATDEDSLVVMASDGLWDVVSDQEACTLAQESLMKSEGKGNSKSAMDARAKLAAEALIETATQKGSLDNITVLVLILQWN